MNRVILMGRLTRDPDIRYSTGESGTAVARYTLAVDREARGMDRYCDPMHEAVIRMIAMATEAAHAKHIPVAVCGELAGDDGLYRTDVVTLPRSKKEYQVNYGPRNHVNGLSSYYSFNGELTMMRKKTVFIVAGWDSTERTQPSGGCSEKKLWGIILTETGQKEILPSGLGAGWPSYGKGAQQ